MGVMSAIQNRILSQPRTRVNFLQATRPTGSHRGVKSSLKCLSFDEIIPLGAEEPEMSFERVLTYFTACCQTLRRQLLPQNILFLQDYQRMLNTISVGILSGELTL